MQSVVSKIYFFERIIKKNLLSLKRKPSKVTSFINDINIRTDYNILTGFIWKDINVYLSQLQLLYNSVTDVARKKLIIEDINKANMFVNNNVVDTEYYLLFKEKDSELINKRIRNLINGFASAGLSTRQVTNDDLRVILDNFLNGGQTTTFGTVMS